MNQNEINLKLYRESLARLLYASPRFLDVFYRNFMNNSDVAKFFHGRNMERIKRKLMTTLELVGDNADNVPGTDMYLEMLGRIHERSNVTPAHLQYWKAALIDTVAECDPSFNDAINLAWQSVLDSMMIKMYANIEVVENYPGYQKNVTNLTSGYSNIGQRLQ